MVHVFAGEIDISTQSRGAECSGLLVSASLHVEREEAEGIVFSPAHQSVERSETKLLVIRL